MKFDMVTGGHLNFIVLSISNTNMTAEW